MRCHLQALPLGRRTLADYEPDGRLERIRALAEPLRGLRVLHLAAAGSRLRSPEILPALLPLYADLGLHAELWALAGERPLWQLVRELEDGLQGAETAISDDAWSGYLEGAQAAVAGRLGDWDVVVAHGPGPLAAVPGGAARAVLRLELDASRPEPGAWARLRPAGRGLRGAVAAVGRLRPARVGGKGGRGGRGHRPAGPRLDRAAGRARGLDAALVRSGHHAPLLLPAAPVRHVAGPARRGRRVRAGQGRAAAAPARAGGRSRPRRPEAWQLLREVSDYAGERTDVLLLTGPGGLGSVELGALRRIARVALESSLAPSSAIATIETLWAGTPVISSGARGAAHPVRDGSEGYLVDTPEWPRRAWSSWWAIPGLAIELGGRGPRAGARALSRHAPPGRRRSDCSGG